MSTITATAWVPRGYAAEFPTKYTVDDQELARISQLAKLKLDDAKVDLEQAQHGEGKDGEEDDGDDEDADDNVDEDMEMKEDQVKESEGGVKLPRSTE
jgi:periodic tryptophan protein 1